MMTLKDVSGLWRPWAFTLINNEILEFYFDSPDVSVTNTAVILNEATFIYFYPTVTLHENNSPPLGGLGTEIYKVFKNIIS